MAQTPLLWRKLGAAEIVYDYELRLKNMILPCTLLFDAELDLFEYKPKINSAIYKWKALHPFLGARIVTKPDPIAEHKFSNERYFASASEQKLSSLDNVQYLKLDTYNQKSDLHRYVDILNEREHNITTVDSNDGLLWRLLIVELSRSERKYMIMLTVHHAIIDAKNGFSLMNQLLEFIDMSLDDRLSTVNLPPFELNPSIEEMLFANDEDVLKNIIRNEKFEISPNCKIPKMFSEIKSVKPTKNSDVDKTLFKFLANESNVYSIMSLHELLSSYSTSTQFKFTSFILDSNILKSLLSKCKQMNCKLTGCLNVVVSLAFARVFRKHKFDSLSSKIGFHLLANLRPFLKIGDLNVGYWAVVMNSIVDCSRIDLESIPCIKSNFWSLAKTESDSIHERIDSGELFENAKIDTKLLELINSEQDFENGGGVHFALSNLGILHYNKLKWLKQREFYFCTSLVKNRWNALIFNGLCTIDNQLCWSLGYVAEFISDGLIDQYLESIQWIIKSILDNQINNGE